jgi:AraC-like DNA-binding protein
MSSAWVRSGVLAGAASLIRELGGDAPAICRAAGLDPQALVDADLPVPAAAIVAFLARAAEANDCESFGLQLAERQDLSVLGPLFWLMRSAATVGQLINDLVRHFALHTRGGTIAATSEPRGLAIDYALAIGLPADDRQTIELGLALFTDELRRHAPAQWQPVAAQLRHAEPRDLAHHRRAFGEIVAFNQDRNAVIVDTALLERPLSAADGRSRRMLATMLERRRMPAPQATVMRVEGAVRALLPFSSCSIEEIADALALSVRTLQRQLAASGTSFQQVRDRVRADLASKYLQQSALSLAEISEILGYSEPSAFTRSFRRWHGTSPREARRRIGRSAPWSGA